MQDGGCRTGSANIVVSKHDKNGIPRDIPTHSGLSTTSSTFVLLVVGVVWKVNRWPSTSTPRGAQTSMGGGIELKIGGINYLGGLTKGAKFQICNPPGVVWAIA